MKRWIEGAREGRRINGRGGRGVILCARAAAGVTLESSISVIGDQLFGGRVYIHTQHEPAARKYGKISENRRADHRVSTHREQ